MLSACFDGSRSQEACSYVETFRGEDLSEQQPASEVTGGKASF